MPSPITIPPASRDRATSQQTDPEEIDGAKRHHERQKDKVKKRITRTVPGLRLLGEHPVDLNRT